MRVGVIINPISGGTGVRARTGERRSRLAHAAMREAGVDGDVVLTAARGHASELARSFVARAFDRVVAWGGDGTANEVAGPLLRTGIVLGIVPSGSGDGLARSLGLSRRPEAALRLALSGEAGAIDAGVLGGRHFLNIGGVGFDAAVACAFNARRKRGALGYVTGSLTAVFFYECDSYRIEIGDEILTGSRFVVAFANGRQYGNGIVLAPDADPTDGWLNAVVVAGGSAIRQLWRARRLAFAPLRPAEGVRRLRVQRARISGPRLLCHVDGEFFEASGELDVSVMPRALQVAGSSPAAPTITSDTG